MRGEISNRRVNSWLVIRSWVCRSSRIDNSLEDFMAPILAENMT
ncbi:hypothetical protein PA05_2471 [Cutibacterium acnes P05]|nr:hypothetical protein [Cutibacterium acnes P05]